MTGLLEQFSNWNFYLLGAYPKGQIGGLALNIILAVLSLCISFIFGVLLGYSRLSSRRYIRYPCIAYIELVRSTPLIMIIFWFYFFLPYLVGRDISLFGSAVISLSVYASAYQAEIVRAGIMAIPCGQLESALTTGMSRYQSMRHIVLPQAFRMMLPSFVSFFNSLFKDTSVTYIIGIIELTQAGIIVSQREPNKMYAAYLCVATGYFVICFSLSRLARRLEKRIGVFDLESYRPEATRDEFMLLPRRKRDGQVCLTTDSASK